MYCAVIPPCYCDSRLIATLSARLKEMEKNGLITRKVYDETPLKVEYFLTEKGLAMKPILDQMAAFFPWNTVRKTRLKMESQEACRMFIINCL
ncbi:MAG: helix-turn-helix transcriptional regulator [Thermoproteota archaeon]|nr:helix-turn-helix transcriptional regulator [Thermoproteota archaeon]